jgi:hypothetical protein
MVAMAVLVKQTVVVVAAVVVVPCSWSITSLPLALRKLLAALVVLVQAQALLVLMVQQARSLR